MFERVPSLCCHKATGQAVVRIDGKDFGARARLGSLRWRHSSRIILLRYLPDSKGILTAAEDGSIRIWDMQADKVVRHFKTLAEKPVNPLTSAAISPDGKVLAIGTRDNLLSFWDLATGIKQRQVRTGTVRGILSHVLPRRQESGLLQQ